MGGSLLLGESLAGIVVAIMYAGGQLLESYALGRARREMQALIERAPRRAMRYEGDRLADVAIEELRAGDRVLVRRGEVVPVDGTVDADPALLDQSALTGEAMPVTIARGGAVMSGSTNVGMAFDLAVTRLAAESTFAGIVRLVEAAARQKAPIVRIADRYALAFLALTLGPALLVLVHLWPGKPGSG
jgi:P-type E1-E2 ATPase